MPVMSPWDTGDLGGQGGSGVLPGGGGGLGTYSPTDPNAREAGYIQQLVSEGPIYGLVNGLKDVKLDGTPILDAAGNPNFTGLAFALTAGTNTQAMIPGFTGVESETSVNVKVPQASPVTRTISTTGISAIRVRIAIPALKVINATSGAESGASVQVKIERQSASYNGGAWETVTLEGNGVISGKFGSKYTKAFRIETPAAGPWSIRVTRLTADHTSGAPDYTQDETWWDAYTEVTDVKLRMPYSAVAALRVDAKQFRQIPKLTMKVRLRLIQVPSNYNPTTRVYTGIWDGTFQTAWSDNPAWVWYDLASHTRYGAGTVLDASKIDKWALYTIGQYCDQLVSDGNGGTEPRFRCNLYLQSQEEALKVLGDLASVFRGMVYSAGGMVTAVQDVDAAPSAIFTASNVIDGRFSYQGAARKSRHSAALVSWQDPNNGYQASVEYVEDQDAITRYGYNPTQIAALGATSQAQARRLGVWLLLTESMSTETVTFSAGLEGSTLRPGVVIGIQDQFRAATGRLGGRCAAESTTSTIQLDSTITVPAGTQTLYVRLPDGTVQSRTVTTPAGPASALAVSSPFSVAPNALSQWALGVALYRVVSIKKGDGITYDITALEHNPAKYALVDSTTITPGAVKDATILTPPSGITLADVVRVEKDKLVQSLTASWAGTAVSYEAEASLDYGPWQPMKVNALAATLEPIVPGTWRVRVRGTYAAGVSAWASSSRTVATPTQTATDAAAAAAAAAAAMSSVVVPNPNFDQDMASTWPNMTSIPKASAPAGCPTAYCGRAQARDQIATPKFPVTPGQQLFYEAWIDTTGSVNAGSFGLYFEDASGALFSPSYLATAPAGTPWGRYSYICTVPAGAVAAHCFCQIEAFSSFGSVYFTGLRVSGGSAAQAAAASAASAAAAAQASANTALADIANITSDNVLSMGEKSRVIQDWSVLSSEQAGIDAQAAAYAVSHAAYDSALSALSTYLGGLSPAWNDTTQDTPIVGSTFRTNWANAYTAKTTLLNAIYAAAKALADGAQSTANTAITNAAAAQTSANNALALAPAIVTNHTSITLPSTSYPAGKVVFQTVDNTLWQVNNAGTGWQTPSMQTSLLIGTIVAGQIAAGAVGANALAATIAMLGVITSTTYTAGTSGAGPVGYKLSGPAFTTTYRDGTTNSNCHMEVEGAANINGYKVDGLTTRVFSPFNRIANPVFAFTLQPWGTSGTNPPVWYSGSSTTGTGCAEVTATAGASSSATSTGSISQAFSVPALQTGQTVSLTLKTGFRTYTATQNYSGYVKAYIMNCSTGTETLLGTWSYSIPSGSQLTQAWTDRSVDITSHLSAGGDFVVRFELQAAATNSGAGSIYTGVAVDEVKVIA